MYIAASSRDRPRRGSGRISERARAMATPVNLAYRQPSQTSEPRNEIPDEPRRVLRLIPRSKLLTHDVEGLPDAGILRINDPVPVELFVVLGLNDLEHGHDQIVGDIVGCLGHATGCDHGVGLAVMLGPLLEAAISVAQCSPSTNPAQEV